MFRRALRWGFKGRYFLAVGAMVSFIESGGDRDGREFRCINILPVLLYPSKGLDGGVVSGEVRGDVVVYQLDWAEWVVSIGEWEASKPMGRSDDVSGGRMDSIGIDILFLGLEGGVGSGDVRGDDVVNQFATFVWVEVMGGDTMSRQVSKSDSSCSQSTLQMASTASKGAAVLITCVCIPLDMAFIMLLVNEVSNCRKGEIC